MDFKLGEEHEMLRQSVRDFAEGELAPGVADRDENEYFDRSVFDKMGELGLTGIPFEEKYGGAGMDYLAYAIAVEELGRVDPSAADTLSAHVSLGAWPILAFGTEEQKSKYLIPLAEGTKLGAFGLTEAGAGSDAIAMTCKADLDGESYVLNGRKIFITNAGAADTYVVFARTGPKELRSKAFSAFIVEKGTPGFSFGKFEKKMGLRGTQNCDLVFEDCRIPKENLLGKEGEGFKISMQTLDGGRIGIAAQSVGIAQGAFELARDYAKQRVQFGKPISALQAIQFKLADMALEIKASRLLTYNAAWKKSQNMDFGIDAAMAKLKASETANKVANQAVQIHGGYGYTREYPVERIMRDAKITEIYEGTSEIQRVVISNSILR
ncbi:Acyl-CoA dehydrogenase/oxidase C-terminal [Syntrophomonas zehnderi OL-4]|uniref:Acyl-CoA dehydrogenase/oxidase C-terminal n=1 Tax=Syntrophomonas zehnderi OL-4 TaxID=690567 RepID=A0A0E4C9J6_9FIRM|nr:acyl-CoA dehydrogenase [Syntrophomonas zehnderi]CFY02536.1 Acyl-CoA dehydrogenase/oxidase C-terminal [Syntrophomonas zehnderi OL-4]